MIILAEKAQVEGLFDLFGDSANLYAKCTVCMEHTICSEINLDTPDGTVDAPDRITR